MSASERRHGIVRLPTNALWDEQTYRDYIGAIERRAGRERRTVERLSLSHVRLSRSADDRDQTRSAVDVRREDLRRPNEGSEATGRPADSWPEMARSAGPSLDRRSPRAGRRVPASSMPVTHAQPPQQGGSQGDGAPFTVPTLRPAEGAGQRPDTAGDS